MDKISKVLEIQRMLNSMSDHMFEIENDLNTIIKCIEKHTIISNEVSEKVVGKLQNIMNCNDTYNRLCRESELDKQLSENIDENRNFVDKIINDFELNKQLAKYKRFLYLKADDDSGVVDLLNEKKAEMQKILDNYSPANKKDLEPYNDFVEAMCETDAGKIVMHITNLMPIFGEKLTGAALISKKIQLLDNNFDSDILDEVIVEKIENESITDEAENKTNEVQENTETSDKFEKTEKDNSEETALVEKSENESEEINTEEKNNVEEISEAVERGLIVSKDIFDKDFYVLKSNAEAKKVGAKIFINDIKAKHCIDNAMTLKCIEKSSIATAEYIKTMSDMALENAEQSLEYLYNKGYLIKVGIEDIGYYYTISLRGLSALNMKNVRTFLKLNSRRKSEIEEAEEVTLYGVLTRIIYMKFFVMYINKMHKMKNKAGQINVLLSDEHFAFNIYSSENTTQEKIYACTGTFWNSKNAENVYLHALKEKYVCKYINLLVVGINEDTARKITQYIIEKLELSEDNIYYYGMLEDTYTKYDTGEKINIDMLFESDENIEATDFNEDSSEHIMNDDEEAVQEINDVSAQPDEVIAKTEEAVQELNTNEVISEAENADVDVEKNDTDIIEEKHINIDVEKDIFDNSQVDSVMNNTYDMIMQDKMYCAITYLHSMTEYNAIIKDNYNKLAYAINEPYMKCSYNSKNIFSIYSNISDVFSEYLMIAACVRNFFMSHINYDYDMQALYTQMKNIPCISENTVFLNAVYRMIEFKNTAHKGIDFYADYRVKDKIALENELKSVKTNAESYYDIYIDGQPKNHKGVKRFVDTWKMIFSNKGEIAECLRAIINNDYDTVELVEEYLISQFIGENCSLEYSNLDMNKINDYINDCWNRAYGSNGSQYKTSELMSGLRNNLINAIEKVVRIMCKWVDLVNKKGNAHDDALNDYNKIKKELINELSESKADIHINFDDKSIEEKAGIIVLENTLQELISRLDGSYNEKIYKYYYIDFLRGEYVLLNESYLPDMRGKFDDFQELSLSNRILKHANEELIPFEEKLYNIFNCYGDDYGTAELIVDYLKENGDPTCGDEYDFTKSEELAEKDAEVKMGEFIENLELAQSYGQIEETRENKKEKMHKIANEWFEYAKSSKNYGFFNMVLDKYEEKIRMDAKKRGDVLSKELNKIKEQGDIAEQKQYRIEKIQEMIDEQNYTVAEDLLSRINSDDYADEIENKDVDYLQKFIDEYDYNHNLVANCSYKLKDLVSSHIRNKDDKGARKLIENWMSNGTPMGKNRLYDLLDALGFANVEIKDQKKIGKIDNYIVNIKETVGRKTNYKHPIAAFGSKACEDGFRVVCLFGKYDADRLIEEFKNIAGTKNTLVLLDYALTLFDRRKLARKIKSDLGGQVFAVIDRVLLMFLVNNYSVQFINQILMAVMMPFSYYQPYVWDSSKVMPPEIFIGRKEELEKIESPSGVNIVYGGRQLGKSALLKMAKMNIDNDENNDRAVFVEIKGMDYRCAARKIGHELYDVGILDKEIDTTDWEELARAIKKRLQDKPDIPYLLLLLDEADTFIDSCESVNFQPFDALKDIQSVGMDRFKFVIAGLHNIVRFKRDAALSNNSVLTHLTSITIKPFNSLEARQLLEEPLYCLGLRFPKDKQFLVALILASTNYFPGLIQLYCANLIEAMRKNDYAGYEQCNTPAYEVNPNHIKKVLADADFMNQIREKFEITLKLDEDNMYYIIALLIAYLYHLNANIETENEGFCARDIIKLAEEYNVKKVAEQSETVINGLLQELLELNILRQTVNNLYLFSRYSFFQMMGSMSEIEDKLLEYMEE